MIDGSWSKGDRVRRINGFYNGMEVGDEDIINGWKSDGFILEESGDGHDAKSLELCSKNIEMKGGKKKMGRIMNYNDFFEHVKENGITKVRTTECLVGIPRGTILFFGIYDSDSLSTYDGCTEDKNLEFNYEFDYKWNDFWKTKYTGNFELVEDENKSSDREFKIGDRVKRIKDSYGGMCVGDIGTIKGIRSSSIDLEEFGDSNAKYNLELVEDENQSPNREFKIGDKVKGIKNDIIGCEGIIEVMDHQKISIRFTKLGNQDWHDGTHSNWKIGGLSCFSNWLNCLELVKEEKEEKTPSKNVNMTTKKIYSVLIVNKKTGIATKDEKVIAVDEQQAILKAFKVDAENTFIKVEELGSYEEEKPVQAILVKQEVAKANPKTTPKK